MSRARRPRDRAARSAPWRGRLPARFPVASAVKHLRELLAQDADGPANGVTVGDRVHAAMHTHARPDPSGGRQLRIFRPIDVAFLDVEAVETQQRGLLAIDIGRHFDGDALVRMILDIGIPKLVPDNKGQGISGELYSR